MTEEGAKIAQIMPSHKIASITTNSIQKILNLFLMEGEKSTYLITRLKAIASNLQDVDPLVDDRDYGIIGFLDRPTDSFSMDYKLKVDDNGNPINPIDQQGIKRIEDDMRKLAIEDAAVEYLQVLIRDPLIGQLAGVNEELFHATITSDRADGDLDRSKIKEHPVNEHLIKNCGFKYRILHCRKLIDRRQELTVPKGRHKYVIHWVGETFHGLKSPIKVAQRLREHFGEYKLLKTYGPGVEDTLVLLSVER